MHITGVRKINSIENLKPKTITIVEEIGIIMGYMNKVKIKNNNKKKFCRLILKSHKK